MEERTFMSFHLYADQEEEMDETDSVSALAERRTTYSARAVSQAYQYAATGRNETHLADPIRAAAEALCGGCELLCTYPMERHERAGFGNADRECRGAPVVS